MYIRFLLLCIYVCGNALRTKSLRIRFPHLLVYVKGSKHKRGVNNDQVSDINSCSNFLVVMIQNSLFKNEQRGDQEG